MRGTPSGSYSFLFQSLPTWGGGGSSMLSYKLTVPTDSITRVETSPSQPQERLSYFLQVIRGWAGGWWWQKEASIPESLLSGEDCFSDRAQFGFVLLAHACCLQALSSAVSGTLEGHVPGGKMQLPEEQGRIPGVPTLPWLQSAHRNGFPEIFRSSKGKRARG